jgi:hypothetical protein
MRDWTELGYDYPKSVGLNRGDPDAVRDAIGNIVNQLYSGQSTVALSARPASLPATLKTAAAAPAPAPAAAPALAAPAPPPAAAPALAAQDIHAVSLATQDTKPAAAPVSQETTAVVAAGAVRDPSAPTAQKPFESKQHGNPHVTTDAPPSGSDSNIFYQWTARIHRKQQEPSGGRSGSCDVPSKSQMPPTDSDGWWAAGTQWSSSLHGEETESKKKKEREKEREKTGARKNHYRT